MCLVGEVRDANGCCGAAAAAAPEIRCPAGTTWNATQRACIGRRVCPVGSHPSAGQCIADAVACPPGTRREEGACISEITCPPGARLQGNRCVTDVTCPPATTLTNGQCVSQDVTCPAGTTRQEGLGCVAPPACPPNSQLVEGRGCVGAITCPAMTHLEGDACVPDHVCLDGQQWTEGECRSVCLSIEHSRWDGERRSCVCEEAFIAEGSGCVARPPAQQCPEGAHRENNQCVSDVICPDGFRFEQNRGCLDQSAEREAARQRDERAREERFRRSELAREERENVERRWSRGPGAQLWGGGGYQFIYMPNAWRAITFTPGPDAPTASNDAAAVWNGPVVTGGATFISGDLSLSGSYTYAPGSVWQSGAASAPCPSVANPTDRSTGGSGFCVSSSAMHLAMLDLGQQGVGPRHAWRFGFGLGYEFSGASFAGQFSYRSTIRIAAGFFVAIEARLLGMLRFAPSGIVESPAFENSELLSVPAGWLHDRSAPNGAMVNEIKRGSPGVGGGGNIAVLLGYSFH